MTTWAVLATGPSMSQTAADCVRGRCKVVAVSDAYKLAPWADILVSTDLAWWRHHPEALDFAGEKFCGVTFDIPEGVTRHPLALSGSNSGLLAVKAAVHAGATRVLMLGFDMQGSHYFGAHPAPLKNTKPSRFDVFRLQFASYQPKGVEILNCTPSSNLTCYPRSTIYESLVEPARLSA